MSQKDKNLNTLINCLLDFINEDILLGQLCNTDLEGEIYFDCNLWNNGLIYPSNIVDPLIKIKPIKEHFLQLLSDIDCFINGQLCNCNNKNYDYKSQLNRFLYTIMDLKNKVLAIQCSNSCNDFNIISVLLTTLIQTVLKLITILENLNTLLYSSSYDNNFTCISSKTFEIFMGIFINSVTDLQCLLQDWYLIAITLFNSPSCATKPYVASYVPKTYIPQPQPPNPLNQVCPPCTPVNSPFAKPPYYNSTSSCNTE